MVTRTRTLNQKVEFHKIAFIKLSEHKVLIKTAALENFSKLIFRKTRRGFRTLAKPSIEFFVTITNDWKALNIDKKSSIVDIAGVLDSSLKNYGNVYNKKTCAVIFLTRSFHIQRKCCIRFNHNDTKCGIITFCISDRKRKGNIFQWEDVWEKNKSLTVSFLLLFTRTSCTVVMSS